jgi:hypothetical protein
MTYYAPVSLPSPWQGKFLPCQPQDFSLLAGALALCPSVGFQRDSRPKARSTFSPKWILFPYFPVRQGKTAGVGEAIRSCALGSCEMHPQADIVGVTDEDRTAG